MAAKLNKRFLESTPLKDRAYEIWDSEIKCLHIIFLPSGRKTFYFRHYDQEKKNQRLKIGTFGNISRETAREIAKSLAGDLARGKDPKREKSEKISQKILFCEFF